VGELEMENPEIEDKNDLKSPIAFFLMPVDILKGVHDELSELLGPDSASNILYNCGFRSGINIVNDMNIEFPDLETLKETLPELWLQMGIGVFQIEEIDSDHVILICEESNEAVALRYTGRKSCNLTRGYIAGMISKLLENTFTCEEKTCVSHGDDQCVFHLTVLE
jgi:predicted hydrocarbon binding protein